MVTALPVHPAYQSLLRSTPRQYMRFRRGVRLSLYGEDISCLSLSLTNYDNRVQLYFYVRNISRFFNADSFVVQENSDRKDQGSCQRTPSSAACSTDGRGSTTNSRRARRWRSSTSSWTFTRNSMSCRAVRSSSTSRPSTGEHFLFLHFFFYVRRHTLKDINNGRSNQRRQSDAF